MDLSMHGLGKKGKGDTKGKRRGDGKNDKKGKGKGKDNAKATGCFAGCCFGRKAWGRHEDGLLLNENPKSGQDSVPAASQPGSTITGAVDITKWMFSVTNRASKQNEFPSDSGAATSVCQQRLSGSLCSKPGAGVELRSATGQRFTTTCGTHIFMRTHDGANVSVDFEIAPKMTSLHRAVTSVGQVADRNNITIVFRSAGGMIFNEITGDRIEFDRAGGLRADTSAKRAAGTGGTRMLIGQRAGVRGDCGSATRDTCELTPKAKKAHTMNRVLAACSKFAAVYDGSTKAFFANMVPCEGTGHGCAERALAVNVLSIGHRKMMLHSDQEPSIIDVKHKASTPTQIVHEESSAGDSNSNGSIERANQTIQGQIRAIKDFTERQIDATMGLDSSTVKWLVRCGLGENGKNVEGSLDMAKRS